jgi:hypothetical protein
MYAHPAEVPAETQLEESTGRCVKWLPGRAERLTNDARRNANCCFGRLGTHGLQPLRLFLTGGAFAAEPLGRGRDGDPWGGHADHLVGDTVRLMLKRIVDLSDNELCLYDAREWSCGERG